MRVTQTVADLAGLSHEERLRLLDDIEREAADLAMLRGALLVLLHEPAAPAPLLDAKETARRLNVSVDTVRARGAEWDIEVFLGDGLCRYDPARVEALRQRRRAEGK